MTPTDKRAAARACRYTASMIEHGEAYELGEDRDTSAVRFSRIAELLDKEADEDELL